MNRQPTKEIFENIPQMPVRERDRRWKAIRGWMAKEGVDCIIVIGNDLSFGSGMAHFRYFSNIASRHGGFLLFPLNSDPVAFLMPPHMTWPIHPYSISQDWMNDVHHNVGIDAVLKTLKERVNPLRKVGIVFGSNNIQPDNMPHSVYAGIQDTLKGVEIVNASPFIFEQRMIKSGDEIAFLREAGKIHNKMIHAMIDETSAGSRESDVYASMINALIKNGGEAEIFNLLLSGPVEAPELQHLLHGLDPNISPTRRVLKNGDTLISETHATYGGYMTAAEFTVCAGTPPQKYRRLFDAAVECLNAAMEKLKPGNAFIDALEAEKRVLKKYGLGWLELGFHGHGLSSPESPQAVYMGMNPDTWMVSPEQENIILQENMVVGTNIDVYDPDWRSDVGVMFGDTVLIREKPELIVNVPQFLPVK